MAAVSTIVAVGALAAGAYSANEQSKAGNAAGAAGRANAAVAAQNAGAEAGSLLFEAEEARRVSQFNAERVRVQARELKSSQRAVASASGFMVDSGTAQMIQEETDNLSDLDALALRTDGAIKEQMGRIGAENIIKGGTSNALAMIRQGDAQNQALQGQAMSTFLSAAAGAASRYGSSTTSTSKGPSVAGWGGFNGTTFSGNKGMGD